MYGMISSSAPRVQRPQLSPMSALRSMNLAIVSSSLALASREHARERVDEAVHILVGHREGARAESSLGQENPLVQEAQEHARRRLPVLGPRRTIVAQRLRRPVQPEQRPEPGHLAAPPGRCQQACDAAAKPLAE